MEDNLVKIQHDLENSTDKMKKALQVSQQFLAGYQFEKAKDTTSKCMVMTEKTVVNIQRARNYLGELRIALDEYGRCGYEEA